MLPWKTDWLIIPADFMLTFRPANLNDAEILMQWRNDPSAYENFLRPKPVEPKEHLSWLKKTINDKKCRLFIILEDQKPIGQIRFDQEGDEKAEISISIDKNFRGKGRGVESIKLGSAMFFENQIHIKRIIAKIKIDNAASASAFLRAGYNKIKEDDGILYYEVTMLEEIFKPDNFSESEIKYKEIKTPRVDLQSVLNNYFDQYKIIKILQPERAEINSENFQIIIEREGREASYLLRKHKILKSRKQIDFYSELLVNLFNNGVRVSQIIKNKDGRLSAEADGNFYTLFNFIEASYFSPTEEALKSIAQNVAKIHNCFNKISDKYFEEIERISEGSSVYFNIIKNYSVGDFENIEKIILKKNKRDSVDDLFLAKADIFKKTITEVKKYQEKIEQLPKQIIHSDLHPHNVLMQSNKVEAIIDFDGVRISQQARDVAFAIYRFGRQFFIRNQNPTKADAERIRDIFLGAYESAKILSVEEKELMPFLIKDEFLKKLLFVLKGAYLNNNHTWSKDLPKFIAAFEEIDYFWPNS